MSDNNFFLTIVTRACRRPQKLAVAIASIQRQTDPDCEQIFIVDMKTRGVHWANQQYAKHIHRCDGLYTMTVDDDSRIPDKGFIAKLKAFASDNNYPDVIMVKCKRPRIKPYILPKKSVWGKRNQLRVASTNGGCYIVKTEAWKKYAYKYGRKAGGDWGFLEALKNDKSLTFAWFNIVSRHAQQLGRGRLFDVPSDNMSWWRSIVKRFSIVRISRGDYRLQHFKQKG